MVMSQAKSEYAAHLPFPKKGANLGGKKVLKVSTQDKGNGILSYEIHLPKGTTKKEVPSLLRSLFNAHLVPAPSGHCMVKHHDYQIKAKDGNVAVVGAMHIVPIALANPGKKGLTALEDFDQEYSKMEISEPGKFFRTFSYKGFNGPQFRARLWSFVGYMGENYGYCDDKNIYHRRASLVMPKIKITKAPTGAKMMYHTHPRKDEPSLSSPDDYLLYFDLSYEPRSIRHFYTVMADRMDHFHIVPKKNSKKNFVKLSEDKFIEEVEAQLQVLEEKHTDKYPKDDYHQDLRFCEAVTKDLVKWMNKKYAAYATIKYKCYYKVRKNPVEPEFTDLHLGDEFIAKAIADVRDSSYGWPTFGGDIKYEEKYAYWWTQYYFQVKDQQRLANFGFNPGMYRGLNHYLDLHITPEYTNFDLLSLVTLHSDIIRSDEKVRDGIGKANRIEDLTKEMELPDEVRDAMIMIEEARSLDVYSEEARTLTGDYWPILLTSNFANFAVETMGKVEAGELSLQQAKHEVYANEKDKLIRNMGSFLIEYKKPNYDVERKVVIQSGPNAGELQARGNYPKCARINPAPRIHKSIYYAHINSDYFATIDLVGEALEKYAKPNQPLFGGRGESRLTLQIPYEGINVGVMVFHTTGKMQFDVPSVDEPDKAALHAYGTIVNELNKFGLKIPTDDLELGTIVAQNPNKNAQVITFTGPSGSGKSTIMRVINRRLKGSKIVPTYSTRPPRKSDKKSERVSVTKTKFKEMINQNEFLEWVLQKNGHYYGRRYEDMQDATYLLMDVSLPGLTRMKKAFPGAYNIFIEPTEKPKAIYQRLLRRGDMSPQEAKGRSQAIPKYIQASHKVDFDYRTKTSQGKFESVALDVLDKIPKPNPASSVGDLIHPIDKERVIKTYDRRLKSMFRSKSKAAKRNLAKLRTEFNWKGRTSKSLFEAVAKQIDTEIDASTTATVYRGAISLPMAQEDFLAHAKSAGVGEFWSTYKEGADIYVSGRKFDYAGFIGGKAAILEAQVHIPSSVNWIDTFSNRLYFPEERELALSDEVVLKSVRFYPIGQKANNKYITWATTGKNWKPWVDPSLKPEVTYRFNDMVKTYVNKDNPQKGHEDSIVYGVMDNPGWRHGTFAANDPFAEMFKDESD